MMREILQRDSFHPGPIVEITGHITEHRVHQEKIKSIFPSLDDYLQLILGSINNLTQIMLDSGDNTIDES